MIYFYGGAFNPLTKAHQNILDKLIKKMNINHDKLYIGVTNHDYKTYSYDSILRYQMIFNYMFKKYNFITYGKPFKWEVWNQYYKTYDFLKERFPNVEHKDICIVLGADEYQDLKDGKWVNSEKLLNEFSFKVFKRTNDISSTKVRELLNNNVSWEDVKHYISKDVYQLLKKKD